MQNAIIKLGLSPKAAKAYLACMQTGPATMTQIAKTAGLKRPSTYLAIDELLMRGFVSVSKKGRRTFYVAEHPRRFLQILRTREREMERMLPELEALYYGDKEKPRVRMYEGKEAMLRMYEETFQALSERHSELLFFTAIGDLQRHFPEALELYYKLISEGTYRIRELLYHDERDEEYLRRVRKLCGPAHRIRLLDSEKSRFFNTDNIIFEDTVMMFSLKKAIYVVVIEDAQIADTMRALFNAAWDTAKDA